MKLTGLRSFSGRNIVAAFIGVLGILGAPRENVWANDIAYRETIYDTDFASAGVGGMRDANSATLKLSGVSGDITKAYLYWHGPMNSVNPLANASIRVNNQAVTGQNIGLSDDNCWGFNNSQAYRADVTAIVKSVRNGSYVLTQFLKQGTNINANGASLLVFFKDSNTANNRDVVLFDGNDSNAQNTYDTLGWNVVLPGVKYTSGSAFIQMHVSDGQVYPDDSVILNGNVLEERGEVFQGTTVPAANNGPEGRGNLWDIKTWDITTLLAPGTNTVNITHGYIGHDCISLVIAAINLPVGAAPPPPPPPPPPGNLAPVVTGTPEITINKPIPLVVPAVATDANGDALTYTIAIDTNVVQTGSIPAGTPTTSGAISVTNTFTLGQHTVVFTANDGQASGSFTTIVNAIDNTPPVLNLPTNITVSTDLGKTNAVVAYIVTATDDWDPNPVVISLPPSGNVFNIGTTVVTVTAVDASGNSSQGTFTVTVIDGMPPDVQCPPSILQNTDPGSSNAVVYFSIPAADNMPGVGLTCQPPSGSTFPIGITTVVCTARDATGNTASCMFTVTIVDREPPVIIVPTNMIVATDISQCSAVVNYAVTVTDNAPGATVLCAPPSGSVFVKGVTTVVCEATDVSLNKATNSFTVTVVDLEKPSIQVPANLTAPTEPGKSTATVTFNVTATDNCSNPNVVCEPPSGSAFPIGTTPVHCTATDTSGNTTPGTFNVTVVDTEPPVIVVPTNMIVVTDLGQCSAIVNYTVTVRDNVPGTTLACTPPSGSTFPLGVTPVVCVATDAAANTMTNSFTVTVSDAEKPVLTVPANVTIVVPAGQNSATVDYTVTATDNCSTPVVVCTPPSGSTFPVGSTLVNCTATDTAGNVGTGSFPVNVTQGGDIEPPVITVPTNMIVATDISQCSAVVSYVVTVQDNLPGATVTCTPPSGSTFPLGVTPVNCLATDAAGNRTTGGFTVTVVDRELPVLTVPANINVITPAGQNSIAVNYTVTATDNCSTPSVVCAPPSGSNFPVGTTAVNCTATDNAGNVGTGTFSVIVTQGIDTEPPVITVPTNMVVATDISQCSAVVSYVVTVQDNLPGATVSCTPTSGSTFPLGVTPVNCTATDAAGNLATGSFTVTVVDRELPVVAVPANINVTVPAGQNSTAVSYTVTATDNCSTPPVVCVPPSDSSFQVGSTTVNCTATDAAGNVGTGSFSVTVTQGIDTEPPVITVPTNMIVATDISQCSAVVSYLVTVQDNLPGATVTCTPPSGSTFPLGVTPVNCTATDAAGNGATGGFTVTVVDRELPILSVPANINVTVPAGQNSTAVSYTVTATDNCSTPILVCTPASGSTFQVGSTTVNCTATDSAGNVGNGSFSVNVTQGIDTEPPVITVPTNMIVATDISQCSAVVSYLVTVQDNLPGATVTCTPPSGSTFPLGVTPVNCTATDAAGNGATGGFTVTVVDRELPVLAVPPNVTIVVPAGQNATNVTYAVTATDNCSTPTVVCVPPSGSTFQVGSTTVNCTATDAAGNVGTGSFPVNVTQGGDIEPPVITVPTNMIVATDISQCSAVVSYAVTVQDNLPGATVSCTPVSGSTFPLGITPVNCAATDAAGNRTTGGFTVTVVDRELPVVTVPANINVTVPAGQNSTAVAYTVTATDNCSTPTVVCMPPSGSTFQVGSTTVNCTATDAAGNVGTGSFSVNVTQGIDTEPPVITVPTNMIVATDISQCSAVVNYLVTVQDNLPGAAVVCTPAPGSTFPLGVTPVNCTATDAAGNQTTGGFTVTVVDRELPLLTVPPNVTVSVPAGQNSTVVNYTVTATDNCSTPVVVCTPPSGSTFQVGSTLVNCTATDAAGNVGTGSFPVNVNQNNDTEPPVITVPTNMIVAADLVTCSKIVDYIVSLRDNLPGATITCTPALGYAFPLGVTPVNCVAIDAAGNRTTGGFTVTVVDFDNPILVLPANITVNAPSNATTAVVTYNATATDNCSTPVVTCVPPSGSTFPLGTTPVNCTAIDNAGNVTTGTFTVTVNPNNTCPDSQPPQIVSLTPSKSVLWPPNHKMVTVSFKVNTTDDSGTPVTTRIVSVTSNEHINGLGDGNTTPDWQITGDLKLKLRAERSGLGNDRIYTITVESTDQCGNVTVGTTTVTVPHDQGKKKKKK